ncbi:hypothetical protein MXB_4114 [Myxobolus squamalis]|nr:hypothetical protein MXB_4114 [Myxobolus squamalis]
MQKRDELNQNLKVMLFILLREKPGQTFFADIFGIMLDFKSKENLCDNDAGHAHNIENSSQILSEGHDKLNINSNVPCDEYTPLKRKSSIEVQNIENTDEYLELKAKQFKSGEIEENYDRNPLLSRVCPTKADLL